MIVVTCQPKLPKETMCPIEYGLELFGGKWKSRILCVLSSAGVLRYSELRDEDVQVLHGFDSAENAKAYLGSELFQNDVFVALKPL